MGRTRAFVSVTPPRTAEIAMQTMTQREITIAPSLLSCDFTAIGAETKRVEQSGARPDAVHWRATRRR